MHTTYKFSLFVYSVLLFTLFYPNFLLLILLVDMVVLHLCFRKCVLFMDDGLVIDSVLGYSSENV